MDALQQIRKPIEADMERYKQFFASRLQHSNPILSIILPMIGNRQGKMMRPILALLVAKLVGSEVNDNTIYSAATIEFLHTASLVHDDIVDESDQRRGQQSVNSAFGNKAAVLVGDYLLASSLFCSAMTNNPRVVAVMSEAAESLADGELLQLDTVQNESISEDTYYNIIKGKTASLFASCAQVAVLSVSSDEIVINRMREFGELIGICFQIRDDIFDYNNDVSIGKPTGNDMKEGKLTLPVIYAVLSSKREDMLELAKKVKRGDVTQEQIDELVRFTKEQGGIEYAQKAMCQFADKARSLLNCYPDSDVKQALETYVDFVVDRNV